MADKSTNDLLADWALAMQGLHPDKTGGDAVLETAVTLNRLGLEAGAGLSFESEPADFTRLLETLARPREDDD